MPRGLPRLRTDDNRMNQIGLRLKVRRQELKLTQDALCARIAHATDGFWNPDRRDIVRIESGTRIVSDLEMLALAQALECDACWLFIGDQIAAKSPSIATS